MEQEDQGLSTPAAGSGTSPPDHEKSRERLRRLAHVLDSSVPLPGGYRIGVDGIIGLIPGVGDAAGALLSSYILLESHRLGVSTAVLMRMALNVLVEAVVGLVPLAGDLFDFVWKANRRNVALLEHHLREPRRTARRSAWEVAGTVVVVAGLAAAVIMGIVALVGWVWGAVTA